MIQGNQRRFSRVTAVSYGLGLVWLEANRGATLAKRDQNCVGGSTHSLQPARCVELSAPPRRRLLMTERKHASAHEAAKKRLVSGNLNTIGTFPQQKKKTGVELL